MQPIEAILIEPSGCLTEAVTGAGIYEDVIPALTRLKAMGVKLFVAPSHSGIAELDDFFPAAWTGDNPERTIYLTATAEGLQVARSLGVSPVLMMNDPDEAMRLVAKGPVGGIVSLGELPDYVRLVAAENGIYSQ